MILPIQASPEIGSPEVGELAAKQTERSEMP